MIFVIRILVSYVVLNNNKYNQLILNHPWTCIKIFLNVPMHLLLLSSCRIIKTVLEGMWMRVSGGLKANSHMPYRAAFIRTCHAVPLLFSDSAVSFVKVRVVDGRSRTRAGRPHAVSGRPMLIHTCHAMPMSRCSEVAFRTAWSWHGTGAAWHVWIKHGRSA
jgi:hypothetical protein